MGLIFQIWLTQLPLGGFLTCPQLPLGVWPAQRGILEEGVWKGISCWHKLHTIMAPGTEFPCLHVLIPLAVQNCSCSPAANLGLWQGPLAPRTQPCHQAGPGAESGCPSPEQRNAEPRDAHTWIFTAEIHPWLLPRRKWLKTSAQKVWVGLNTTMKSLYCSIKLMFPKCVLLCRRNCAEPFCRCKTNLSSLLTLPSTPLVTDPSILTQMEQRNTGVFGKATWHSPAESTAANGCQNSA